MGQHTRQLDDDPHATAVVVGAGSGGGGIVVRAHHHRAGAGAAQRPHHVQAAHAADLELLEPHVAEAGLAQLRGHVGRGRASARRSPGMRTQRGQGGGVTEGGFAVDGGGQKERGQRSHARRIMSGGGAVPGPGRPGARWYNRAA